MDRWFIVTAEIGIILWGLANFCLLAQRLRAQKIANELQARELQASKPRRRRKVKTEGAE